MWIDTACEALRKARALDLHHDGVSRRVEVHPVGYSKAGHPVMRAWQTGGGKTEEGPTIRSRFASNDAGSCSLAPSRQLHRIDFNLQSSPGHQAIIRSSSSPSGG